MTAANRVFTNTFILYGRIILTVGITLYTTRLILVQLGSTDYGVFSLLVSVVVLLSFVSSAMSTATQRFLSFYHGRQDFAQQGTVLVNSLLLHLLIGLAAVGCLSIAGRFLFNGVFTIPQDRLVASRTVYDLVSVMVFFSILSSPFQGLLIAHERMLWVSTVHIVEALLKLAGALSLALIATDNLVAFGRLTASISVVSFLCYLFASLRIVPWATLRSVRIRRSTIRSLAGFTAWNTFGAFCSATRTKGLAVVLNVFLGPLANAAYGIAQQVGSQAHGLSGALVKAIAPQLMKSEGAGNRDRMLRLALLASKSGFLLFALLAIPCLFEMDALVRIWLSDAPPRTATYCRFILIAILFRQLTVGLPYAVQAVGRIRVYQLIIGALLLLNIPVAYLQLQHGASPHHVMLGYVSVEATVSLARVLLARRTITLDAHVYVRTVLLRVAIPVAVYGLVCAGIVLVVDWTWRFLLTGAVGGTSYLLAVYFAGLHSDERVLAKQTAQSITKRLRGVTETRFSP